MEVKRKARIVCGDAVCDYDARALYTELGRSERVTSVRNDFYNILVRNNCDEFDFGFPYSKIQPSLRGLDPSFHLAIYYKNATTVKHCSKYIMKEILKMKNEDRDEIMLCADGEIDRCKYNVEMLIDAAARNIAYIDDKLYDNGYTVTGDAITLKGNQPQYAGFIPAGILDEDGSLTMTHVVPTDHGLRYAGATHDGKKTIDLGPVCMATLVGNINGPDGVLIGHTSPIAIVHQLNDLYQCIGVGDVFQLSPSFNNLMNQTYPIKSIDNDDSIVNAAFNTVCNSLKDDRIPPANRDISFV